MVLAHIRKQAFTAVVRETGFRGLYFGFSSTLYRDISFNMVFFTSRELFVKLYKHRTHKNPDPWTRVLLGFPAGTLASIVACPFDVVKTRQQGQELSMIIQYLTDAYIPFCHRRIFLSLLYTYLLF